MLFCSSIGKWWRDNLVTFPQKLGRNLSPATPGSVLSTSSSNIGQLAVDDDEIYSQVQNTSHEASKDCNALAYPATANMIDRMQYYTRSEAEGSANIIAKMVTTVTMTSVTMLETHRHLHCVVHLVKKYGKLMSKNVAILTVAPSDEWQIIETIDILIITF